jgi:hypothetical protein
VGVMHAESRELIGDTYSNAPIATGTPPVSPSARLVSTDIKEAGLWLWQGEVPPSRPLLPRPKSRGRQILRRIRPAVGRAGWIAVSAGLALAFLALSMISRPDRPVSADRPDVAVSSASSPAVMPPIVPVSPAEVTEAKLDRVQVPSAPAAKITAQGPEPPAAKGRAKRKLSRTARKTHASNVHKGPLFPTPGVLTPPVMTWHGGGY